MSREALSSSNEVPNDNLPILADARERSAIRAIGHRGDGIIVVGEGPAQATGTYLPKPNPRVIGSAGERRPVRAERHVVHGDAGLISERQPKPAGGCIPQRDPRVGADASEGAPIRTKEGFGNATGVTSQGAVKLAGRRAPQQDMTLLTHTG